MPAYSPHPCPLCAHGLIRTTPTVGRYECDCCGAVVLAGRQTTVVHVPAWPSERYDADKAARYGGR